MSYVVGTTITATITVTPSGVSTAVTASLKKPDGTTSSPAATALDAPTNSRWAVSFLASAGPGEYILTPTVTGTGAGVGDPQIFYVTAIPPADLSDSYATPADFAAYWPGRAAPVGLEWLLRFASIDIDTTLISAVYDTTDLAVQAALTAAACMWAGELESAFPGGGGTLSGGWGSVAIGTVQLSRANGGAGQQTYVIGAGVSRMSRAYRILQQAGLTGMAPGAAGTWQQWVLSP